MQSLHNANVCVFVALWSLVCVHFFFFRVSGGGLTLTRCPHSNPLANEGCVGLKGMFGGLRQATVLGLEDQSEGPGVMRGEEEGNNRLYWKKREGYCQHCVATSGHMGCFITSTVFFVPSCLFVF